MKKLLGYLGWFVLVLALTSNPSVFWEKTTGISFHKSFAAGDLRNDIKQTAEWGYDRLKLTDRIHFIPSETQHNFGGRYIRNGVSQSIKILGFPVYKIREFSAIQMPASTSQFQAMGLAAYRRTHIIFHELAHAQQYETNRLQVRNIPLPEGDYRAVSDTMAGDVNFISLMTWEGVEHFLAVSLENLDVGFQRDSAVFYLLPPSWFDAAGFAKLWTDDFIDRMMDESKVFAYNFDNSGNYRYNALPWEYEANSIAHAMVKEYGANR